MWGNSVGIRCYQLSAEAEVTCCVLLLVKNECVVALRGKCRVILFWSQRFSLTLNNTKFIMGQLDLVFYMPIEDQVDNIDRMSQ